MASGDVSKGRTGDVSSLMEIVGKAAEDLHSQAGRVGSDAHLARNFGQTLLANGVIDDRKYLVSAWCITRRKMLMSCGYSGGSMSASRAG